MKRPDHRPEAGPEDEPPMDAALEAAYDALQSGRPDEALAEAARSDDAVGRALLEARAFLEMGMLKAAHGALDRATQELGEDDPDVLELSGEIALMAWDFETARGCFESAKAADEPDVEPGLLERLALTHDHLGHGAQADGLMAQARRLDGRGDAPSLDDGTFDRIVEQALASLRPEFKARLSNVRIVREPLPFRGLIDAEEPGATPPDILGLFVGPTVQDSAYFTGAHSAEAELPPSIYLFSRNLERMAQSAQELEEEIRITLFHEIGHLLGLDEDEVAGMGLA